MSKVYEVMIFTASHSCYANVVLNILDPDNEYITYRLFRDQCLQTNEGIFIKDLRIIANRHLENMLIVDNATYSFGFQLENGIPVIPFYDSPQDTELLDLMDYLRKLATQPDVRTINTKMFMYDLINHYCNDYDKLIDIVITSQAN
jgi:CTD small phosphatase-like protein 2